MKLAGQGKWNILMQDVLSDREQAEERHILKEGIDAENKGKKTERLRGSHSHSKKIFCRTCLLTRPFLIRVQARSESSQRKSPFSQYI